MPGFAFPSVGRLGLTSPPSRSISSLTFGTMLRYDCHLSFSMPYALARSPIPCLFLLFVSFLQARLRSGTLALTPGLLGLPVRLFRVVYKETNGSPKFPGFPFEYMPRSSTPVVSWTLALAHPGLLPSVKIRTSAFPSYFLTVILAKLRLAGPQPYKFRGSFTRPTSLFPLASDARCRVCPQGSLLTCWLDFD
jgi:hypothetical protein